MTEYTIVLRGRFEREADGPAFAALVNAMHDAGWQHIATQLPRQGVMPADALRRPSIEPEVVARYAALCPHAGMTSDMIDLFAGCMATVESDGFAVQCTSGSRERLQRLAMILRAVCASALSGTVAADGRVEAVQW